MPDFSDLPPEAPPPKRRPFQVSLATLLSLVLVSAMAASALRCSGMPETFQLIAFIVGGVFLAYLTWRWTAAWRSYGRWNQIQQHREHLEDWARERKKQLRQRDDV